MSLPACIFNWSGGKDSALALYELQQHKNYHVGWLLTSVNEKYQRISMHGVRVALLEQQATSLGIPLVQMQVPETPTMEAYESAMRTVLADLKNKGATASVFGDIFLEDLRHYREKKLAETGLNAVFPLWKRDTHTLIHTFIDLGFKTVVTCVNEQYLDRSFAGRVIDRDFIKDLPPNVDPCGENGEFHTFVFDGPLFPQPIPFTKGEIVYRKYTPAPGREDDCVETRENPYAYGFWYCDLVPSAG